MVDTYRYPLDITKRSYLEFSAWNYELAKISEEVGFRLSTIDPSVGSAGSNVLESTASQLQGNEERGAETPFTDANRKDELFRIYTYIPAGFGESMSSKWDSSAVAHIGNAKEAVGELTSAVSTFVGGTGDVEDTGGFLDLFNKSSDKLSDITKGIGAFIIAEKGVNLLPSAARATIEASSGQRIMPSQSLIYQGSDHRNLNLTYKFAPRNQDEGNQMMNIINSFQNAMVPKIDFGDTQITSLTRGMLIAYQYPPIFKIRVVFKDEGDTASTVRSDGFFEFRAMALTSFDIKYSEGGEVYDYFYDGIPNTATLNIQLRSLFPAYRDSRTGQMTASRMDRSGQDSASIAQAGTTIRGIT